MSDSKERILRLALEAWAALVGGYIYSHKFWLRPRLLKQLTPKREC